MADEWGISFRMVGKHIAKGGLKIIFFTIAKYNYAVNLNSVNAILAAWCRQQSKDEDWQLFRNTYIEFMDFFDFDVGAVAWPSTMKEIEKVERARQAKCQ
jgi:hypothetical protein